MFFRKKKEPLRTPKPDDFPDYDLVKNIMIIDIRDEEEIKEFTVGDEVQVGTKAFAPSISLV